MELQWKWIIWSPWSKPPFFQEGITVKLNQRKGSRKKCIKLNENWWSLENSSLNYLDTKYISSANFLILQRSSARSISYTLNEKVSRDWFAWPDIFGGLYTPADNIHFRPMMCYDIIVLRQAVFFCSAQLLLFIIFMGRSHGRLVLTFWKLHNNNYYCSSIFQLKAKREDLGDPADMYRNKEMIYESNKSTSHLSFCQ